MFKLALQAGGVECKKRTQKKPIAPDRATEDDINDFIGYSTNTDEEDTADDNDFVADVDTLNSTSKKTPKKRVWTPILNDEKRLNYNAAKRNKYQQRKTLMKQKTGVESRIENGIAVKYKDKHPLLCSKENVKKFCAKERTMIVPKLAASMSRLAANYVMQSYTALDGPLFAPITAKGIDGKNDDEVDLVKECYPVAPEEEEEEEAATPAAPSSSSAASSISLSPKKYKCGFCPKKIRNLPRHLQRSHNFENIPVMVNDGLKNIQNLANVERFDDHRMEVFNTQNSFDGLAKMSFANVDSAEKATGRKVPSWLMSSMNTNLKRGHYIFGDEPTLVLGSKSLSASSESEVLLCQNTIENSSSFGNEPSLVLAEAAKNPIDRDTRTIIKAAQCISDCNTKFVAPDHIRDHVRYKSNHRNLSSVEREKLIKHLQNNVQDIVISKPMSRGSRLSKLFVGMASEINDLPPGEGAVDEDETSLRNQLPPLDLSNTYDVHHEDDAIRIPKKKGGLTQKLADIVNTPVFTVMLPNARKLLDDYLSYEKNIRSLKSPAAMRRFRTISSILVSYLYSKRSIVDLSMEIIYRNIYEICLAYEKVSSECIAPVTACANLRVLIHFNAFIIKNNHTSTVKIPNFSPHGIKVAVEESTHRILNDAHWYSKFLNVQDKKESDLISIDKVREFLESDYIAQICRGAIEYDKLCKEGETKFASFIPTKSHAIDLRNVLITIGVCDVARRSKELTTVTLGSFRRPKVLNKEYVLLKAPIHKTWRGKCCFIRFDTYYFSVLCAYVEHYRSFIWSEGNEDGDPLFPSTKETIFREKGDHTHALSVQSIGKILSKMYSKKCRLQHHCPVVPRRIRHAYVTHISEIASQDEMADLAYVMGHSRETQSRYYTIGVIKQRFESSKRVLDSVFKRQTERLIKKVDVEQRCIWDRILEVLTSFNNGTLPSVPTEEDSAYTPKEVELFPKNYDDEEDNDDGQVGRESESDDQELDTLIKQVLSTKRHIDSEDTDDTLDISEC